MYHLNRNHAYVSLFVHNSKLVLTWSSQNPKSSRYTKHVNFRITLFFSCCDTDPWMFPGRLMDSNSKIPSTAPRVKRRGCLAASIKEVSSFGGSHCFLDPPAWVVGLCGLSESNPEVAAVAGLWPLSSTLIE